MNSNLYPCASPHSTCTLPLYLTLHPCLIAHTSISHPTPYSLHPCTSFHTPTPYPTSLYLAPLHMYLNTHSCISPCTSPPTPTTSPHWILHGSWGDSALNQLSCSSPKLGSAEVKQARLTLKNHQFRTVESGSKGISSHTVICPRVERFVRYSAFSILGCCCPQAPLPQVIALGYPSPTLFLARLAEGWWASLSGVESGHILFTLQFLSYQLRPVWVILPSKPPTMTLRSLPFNWILFSDTGLHSELVVVVVVV